LGNHERSEGEEVQKKNMYRRMGWGGKRCRKGVEGGGGRGLKFVAARRREFALQMRNYKIKGAFAYAFIRALPPLSTPFIQHRVF
jgi:hypothetical protein